MLCERLRWLDEVLDTRRLLASIAPIRITHFAAEARSLEPGDVLDCEPSRRYMLLICLLHRAQTLARDNLVEIFIKRMQHLHKRGLEALETLREQLRSMTETMVNMLGEIAQTAQITPDDQIFGRDVRQLLEKHGGPDILEEQYELLSAYHDNNYLILLPRFYRNYRSVLFRMLSLLNIQSTTQHSTLFKALQRLRTLEHVKDEWLPLTLPLNFSNRKWQKLLIRHDEQTIWLHRQQFEICVFTSLAMELKTGDVCVQHSEAYADYREQLLSWEECQPLLMEYCQTLHLPTSAADFVAHLRRSLERTATQVDADYPDNARLSFTPTGNVSLARSKRLPLPEGFAIVRREVARRMPQRSVLDILANLQHWTHFTRHFTPPSGSDPKIDAPATRYILTVFSYGCNLGPSQTAKHTRLDISARTLSFLNR